MKLPKLFGKKNEDEDFDVTELDEDDEDFDVTELDEEDLDENDSAVDMSDDENHDEEDDDEEMVGGDDELDNPFDDEEDDDEEEEETSSKRKALLFAGLGAGVVLLSALGGAGWWYFSAPSDEAAAPENVPGRVEMAMPAPPGSLNAQGSSPNLNALAGGGAAPTGDDVSPGIGDIASTETAPAPDAETSSQPDAPAPSLNSLNSLNSLGSSSSGGGVVVPAVANSAIARIPDQPSAADQSQALSNAPVKALLEEKDGIGDLPKIGPNQVASWQVYARPIDPGLTGPMIGLMFEGIGLSRQASLAAINKLPPEVSMVLSPYGRDLNDWVFRSRLAGHEVFMSLPMESEDFPMEDAGPLALDTRIQLVENQKRMDTVMAQAGGYVGLVSYMGSRFMKAEGQVRKVLEVMKTRGLMFVVGGNRTRNDAAPIAKELVMAHAESEMYIDDVPRIQQIRTNLDKLESLASDRGVVLAMARPYPVTIKSVLDWVETLKDKNVKLVPASKIAKLPGPEQ